MCDLLRSTLLIDGWSFLLLCSALLSEDDLHIRVDAEERTLIAFASVFLFGLLLFEYGQKDTLCSVLELWNLVDGCSCSICLPTIVPR